MGCVPGSRRTLEESVMQDTLKEIRKLYGDEALFLLSDFAKPDVESISTGALLLDHALGVGGIPRGRITEIFGVDSTGKTTICQHIVANAQKIGLVAAFIDVENAVDFDYATACGVDFDTLYISQPDFAEEALGIAEILIKSGEVGLVVLDSIASLSPEKESESDEFKDINVTGMLRAKLLNTFFRRTMSAIRRNDVAVVLTNQMRDNTKSFFGGLQTTGGRGLKHYASVRIKIEREYQGEVKSGGEIIGHTIVATIKKNKVASPFKKAKFVILAGSGIDSVADILTTAELLGIVNKRGAYYTYEGEVIAQGKAKTISALRRNLELAATLEALCKEMLINGN